MAERNAEIAVGITVLAALALVIWSVTYLRQVRLAEGTTTWIVRLPEVGGLAEDDPVTVNGVKKGVVRDIALVPTGVVVRFRLERSIGLTADSRVYVRNVGMMGEKFLAVDRSATGRKLVAERDTILGVYESGVPEVVSRMGTALASLERLSDQIDRILAIAEERNTVRTSLANVEAASSELAGTLRESRADLTALAANLRATSETTRRIAETNEPKVAQALDDASRTSVRLDSLLTRVDQLTSQLTEVTRKVNSGNGTAARLVNDRQLYDETRAALRELTALVREIRADPRKYFKISVF